MARIHPTAHVEPQAELAEDVEVGPFAFIESGVCLGPGCVVGPHVHLVSGTRAGARNRFHSGAVIGDAPQDLKYQGQPTELHIGDDNLFREHVTIHRSNHPETFTEIGNGNFFMANSHVGHNARIGNRNILANGALLAGHVTVEDQAFISGNCLVHQFTRVGRLSLMQGGSAISKDLPPFTIARGDNGICGLNVVGLKRAGFHADLRDEIKHLYHLLFRRGMVMEEAIAAARAHHLTEEGRSLVDFVKESKRGICRDTSSRES